MTKTEMKDKVVMAREELRQVLSNLCSYEEGMTDRQKFEVEKQIEEVLTSLNLIILSHDFEEKRHRDQEAGYVSSNTKDL